jgi:acyl dehydratase
MKAKEIQGYYFEDFQMGDQFVSPGRTITEHDVMAFAGISGDYNQLHTDKKYAEGSLYGERIAHGLLGLCVISGLASRLGLVEGTALAFRSLKWKFMAPIKFGDTIRAEFRVSRKKPLPGQGGGYLELKAVVYNQRDEAVQGGSWALIVRSRERK